MRDCHTFANQQNSPMHRQNDDYWARHGLENASFDEKRNSLTAAQGFLWTFTGLIHEPDVAAKRFPYQLCLCTLVTSQHVPLIRHNNCWLSADGRVIAGISDVSVCRLVDGFPQLDAAINAAKDVRYVGVQ